MGIFRDLKKVFQRNLNKVTDNKIAKTVTGAVSGIADAYGSMTLKSKKHDLVRLPRRASRYISCQKSITEHLHYLLIKDAKKRKECQDRVKSLCGELDGIEKEFLKIDEGFNFSSGNDEARLKAEVAEFESLLRPMIERHRDVSERLEAAINEVDNFLLPPVPLFRGNFYFTGNYGEGEIKLLRAKIRLQESIWNSAETQYKDPDWPKKYEFFMNPPWRR